MNATENVTVEATTDEMSIGGFSITSNHQLTTVHKGFPANCCMCFPKDLIINFPDGKLETGIKFVRQRAITDEYDLDGYHVMSFKFTSLTPDQKMVLKTYLMKL